MRSIERRTRPLSPCRKALSIPGYLVPGTRVTRVQETLARLVESGPFRDWDRVLTGRSSPGALVVAGHGGPRDSFSLVSGGVKIR